MLRCVLAQSSKMNSSIGCVLDDTIIKQSRMIISNEAL